MKTKYIYIIFSIVFLLISCKDDENSKLIFDVNKVTFDHLSSVQHIDIESNSNVFAGPSTDIDWCTATYADGKITIAVKANPNTKSRQTPIYIVSGDNRGRIDVEQLGRELQSEEIPDNIKIPVASAVASSFQNDDTNIDKTLDEDFISQYHSPWSTATVFPVTLTYNFEDVQSIDYLVYHPSTTGNNGHFKEVEIKIATKDKPNLETYGKYNFEGKGTATKIEFETPLKDPIAIQFVVKSGTGNFVACSEMEFYNKNMSIQDFINMFTDSSCSELNPSVTEEDINNIENEFFKGYAKEIFNGDYDKVFRVQEYEPYEHPDILAEQNKTSTYSLRDNPTGMYIEAGQDLVIFAGDLQGQDISVFVQYKEPKFSGTKFTLMPGLNKVRIPKSGLIYVLYHTDEATEPPVKINIATGNINGYFDIRKHTKEDWKRLLNNATFEMFDVVGKYAHLTFDTDKFRQFTPDGMELIQAYDDLVYAEWDFMGLVKYDRLPKKNRMYFLVDYGDVYMYAASYYTGYQINTLDEICDVTKLRTTSCWGPAHEVGHSNQTRPGLKWQGMSEVTNNIHSQYIQTLWGNPSRIQESNTYQQAYTAIMATGIPHNANTDHFLRLIPFWQLKLYMHDVLGNNDFYKDVYEHLRTNADPNTSGVTEGIIQLNFIRIVCEKAKLDLTEFFEAWGFLTPIDQVVGDYSSNRFTITQKQIENLKTEISSKNYPKPIHKPQYISDNTVSAYKNAQGVIKGNLKYSNSTFSMQGWENVAVFELYKDSKLIGVTIGTSFAVSGNRTDYEIYAVGFDGIRYKA